MGDVVSDSDQTSDRYVVREYESGDDERFLSLYESVWGREKSEEWFHWRFVQNPYRDDVDMVVVERDGQLVGAEPLLPYRIKAGSEEVLAYQPVDWIVHPDHRRRGLFTRMTERLLERYSDEGEFLYNFPTDVLMPGLEKFGWSVVGSVPNYYRIQRPSALVDAAVRAGDVSGPLATLVGATDPLVRRYRHVRDRLGRDADDVTVERSTPIPVAEFVALYSSGPPGRIHVTRDEAYFRWRFANPEWETSAYLARKHGEPVAGIVVATEQFRNVHRTCLMDVEPMGAATAGADELTALLGEIVADHRHTDVMKAVGMELPPSVFRQWGFRSDESFPLSRLSSRTTLVVRSLRESERSVRVGGRELSNLDDWLLSLGDQDIE